MTPASARHALAIAVAITMTSTWASFAQDDIRNERVRFATGETSATMTGTIQGYAIVDYILGAAKGQTMHVALETSSTSNYFNVLPPDSEAAIFIGSTSGSDWTGTLLESGDYTVRVYLMRNAARRDEAAKYEISFSITSGPAGMAPAGDAKVAGTPYHATGNLPCSIGADPAVASQCAFGVIRGAPGNAEVHVTSPSGERVLIFAHGKVTTANPDAPLTWEKRGDEWSIDVNGDERYDIPEAVVVGGWRCTFTARSFENGRRKSMGL